MDQDRYNRTNAAGTAASTCGPRAALALALLILGSWPLAGTAATLLFDDFNGTSLDQSVWRLPTGAGTFFGRTQIKPAFYFGQDLRPVVAGGTVTLQLDTYNASAATPGDSFWGQEIQTFQRFAIGADGLSVKARMRFLGNPPGGLVGGFFTWGFDNGLRDELDFELLTNFVNAPFAFTNVYQNADFNTGGIGLNLFVPGFDMKAWNTYEIRWWQDRTEWWINGVMVRQQNGLNLTHDSEIRLNIWAPDAGFSIAYNSFLQPAASAAANQQYQLEIDYVQVSTVPVPAAVWLFGSGFALLVGLRRKYGV